MLIKRKAFITLTDSAHTPITALLVRQAGFSMMFDHHMCLFVSDTSSKYDLKQVCIRLPGIGRIEKHGIRGESCSSQETKSGESILLEQLVF